MAIPPSVPIARQDNDDSEINVQFMAPYSASHATVQVRTKAGTIEAWHLSVGDIDPGLNQTSSVPVPGVEMGEFVAVLIVYEDEAGRRLSADGGIFSDMTPG